MGPSDATLRAASPAIAPRSRRSLLTTLGAAAAALLLGACSVGTEAGTLDPPTPRGGSADLGTLQVRGVWVVVPEGSSDSGARDASVTITIANRGSSEDALTSVVITSPAATTASDGASAPDGDASLRPSTIDVAARSTVVVPGEPRPTITVETDAPAGTYVTATLRFEHAGTVRMIVPVVDATYAFETYGPA